MSGSISGCGHIYCWTGRLLGHLEGVAEAVVDRLVPFVTEATLINERIMELKISHALSVISLVSV